MSKNNKKFVKHVDSTNLMFHQNILRKIFCAVFLELFPLIAASFHVSPNRNVGIYESVFHLMKETFINLIES